MPRDCWYKKLSIHSALLLTFIPLLAVSMGLMLLVMHSSSQHVISDVARETVTRNLELTARYVDTMVLPAQEIVGHLSHHLAHDETINDFSLSRIMLDKIKYTPHLYSIYVGRPDGSFVLAGWRPRFMQDDAELWMYLKTIKVTDNQRTVEETWINPEHPEQQEQRNQPNDSYDPRVRPWYQQAVTLGEPCWTSPYIFYMTEKAGITYAYPIQDRKGQLASIVGIDLRLNTLAEFLDQNRYSSHSSSFIFTEQQKVLAHPQLIDQLKKYEIPSLSSLNDSVLQQAYDAYLDSDKYRTGDIFFTTVATPEGRYDVTFKQTSNGPGDRLIIGELVPEADYLTALIDENKKIVLAGAAILLIFIVAGSLLARSISSPIHHLSETANQIKELNFETSLPNSWHFTEIAQTVNSFNAMLESLKLNRRKNQMLTTKLEQAYQDTLYRLAMAAEYKDKDTAGHLDRVSGYSTVIAEELGCPPEDIELLRIASVMHDVGKLSIPDSILLKQGMLTVEEWEVMKNHTVVGGKILENNSSRIMQTARTIALSHHENWDGSGYPYQLAGEKIPLFGRIVAVADVFDALLSKRSYKTSFEIPKTMEIIQEMSGTKLDPGCVEALETRLTDIMAVYRAHSPNQAA